MASTSKVNKKYVGFEYIAKRMEDWYEENGYFRCIDEKGCKECCKKCYEYYFEEKEK